MDLSTVQEHWRRLGAEDPLWAVYVAPGRRHGGWNLDDFLETGRVEVDGSLSTLEELDLKPGADCALDFGCGVGRLSLALADHFANVVGIDVSQPMIDRALELAAARPGGSRCRFLLNQRQDLGLLPDRSIDLVYSSLVLQHLPVELTAAYAREFARVLKSDGVAVLQVTSRPTRSVKGLAFRHLPTWALAWAQVKLLGYPAPMLMTAMPDVLIRRLLADAGLEVVESRADGSYGGHWEYRRYFARLIASQGP